MTIEDNTYELTLQAGGSIRIERAGHGQTIGHAALSRHGWNSIADAARLIEGRILGKWAKPA